MTPFQKYAHARWVADFPEWAPLEKEHNHAGEPFDLSRPDGLDICYEMPSPANPNNILWVVFTPYDIIVKFAVPGWHEHYAPDFYYGPDYAGDEIEFWPQAYDDALNEYVRPVIEDRIFALHFRNNSVLVNSVEEYVEMNQIESCQYESWSRPLQEFKIVGLG